MTDGDMTTAQLLAWVDKCLGLAHERAEDDAVEAQADAARGHTQAAINLIEEREE